MKKNILLIIVFFCAFLLSQCQHVKEAVKDLNDLAKKEKSEEKTEGDENSKDVFSSSSEALSSSDSEAISSSSSETLKRRKETK